MLPPAFDRPAARRPDSTADTAAAVLGGTVTLSVSPRGRHASIRHPARSYQGTSRQARYPTGPHIGISDQRHAGTAKKERARPGSHEDDIGTKKARRVCQRSVSWRRSVIRRGGRQDQRSVIEADGGFTVVIARQRWRGFRLSHRQPSRLPAHGNSRPVTNDYLKGQLEPVCRAGYPPMTNAQLAQLAPGGAMTRRCRQRGLDEEPDAPSDGARRHALILSLVEQYRMQIVTSARPRNPARGEPTFR